jgi:hypothetical protein
MNRLRVAAHVHSDWSYDGTWRLSKIASTFGRLGYHAVLLAEHDCGFDADRWLVYRAACRQASTSGLLLVPGLEYSDPTNSVHVPVWGEVPFLGEGVDTAELLRRVEDTGAFAILAHIGRRDAWQLIEPEWLRRVAGLELWNRKYDGYAPNAAALDLLREHDDLVPFVSLDFHTRRQFHPLAMTLEMAGDLTVERVFDALRCRRAIPTAFGIPALSLLHGAGWPALRALERTRKRAAPIVAYARSRARPR